MESGSSSYETTINVSESKRNNGKGKAAVGAPATFTAATKATSPPKGGWKKGVAIFDFVLRLAAIAAALGASGVMGTTEQTLPFSTRFFQFKAEYDDFRVFRFFVVANAIAGAYLVLSLPLSIVCIVRPYAAGPRLLLLICDMVMMTLTMAAAAAAAAVVYLIHYGSSDANWLPICQQFGEYCQSTSEAVVASFVASALFMFLIVLSIFAIRSN